MPFRLTRARRLDYKICWELYAVKGITVPRLSEALYATGARNSKNDGYYNGQSIWRGAWIWALQNLSEARKDMNNYYMSQGQVLDDETFYKDIIAKARQFLSTPQYTTFLERNSYLKPYA